jgi:gliding-associated putative ABC transporter substrate-binding component GldG
MAIKDDLRKLWEGKLRLTVFSATGALLVAAILIFANVLSHYGYLRMDWSEGKIYSLSPASKHMLAGLEDPVLIKTYCSPSLPPQYAAVREYLENLLREYATYSRGKVRFESYASDDPAVFRQTAMREGIYPVRFNILEKERYEVREAFLGLVLKYLDKKEVLPFIQQTAGLEYDLSSRIKKMVRPTKKAVGYVSSNGALQLDELPKEVHTKLEEDFDLKLVDLDDVSSEIFKTLDAVMLLGPTQKLDDQAVYALDQALLAGKPVAVAADSKKIDLRNFVGSPLDLGLDGWLVHVGLPVRKNLVLDLQNQKISVSAQQGWLSITNIVDYPPFVVATDLDGAHPLTKGLDSLILPYAAPIDVSTTTAGVRTTALVRSSPKSWLKAAWDRQYAVLNPFEAQYPAAEEPKGPFVLAAVAEGRFTSYFPAPPQPPKKEEAKPGKGEKKKEAKETPAQLPMLHESQAPGRVVVIGTSRFIQQDYPMPATNQAFFLNIVDWLAQDPDLIGIRTKAVAFRPLREISPGWKMTVRYADMFGGPLLVILLGIFRWRRRTAKTAARAALYRPQPAP